MGKSRLEAFSDAVIAIIITILVLDMKIPHTDSLSALLPIIPIFICYILSFIYLGIYWNNHHHMLQATEHVSAGMLWANLHLLFWLSLFPFVTGWMGENHFAAMPTALYGVVLFFASVAYMILQQTIIASQGKKSLLAKAVGPDLKGKISPVLYATGIFTAFFANWIAVAIYVGVALMWLVPDRRIECAIKNN
jgi:uncharacterized membrane protein